MIRNYKITKGTATKLIVIFSTIVYSLFLGAFPFGFGKDYLNYVEIFREIALEGVSFDSRYEPVFVIVTLITKTILRFDYLVFVIFISISASIKIYACRRINGNIFVLVIVYTLMYAPLYDNNQIRAGVGVAIIYLAIAILDTNKYQALTLLFLSVLTHYSMILLVAPIAIWLIFLSTKL